MSRTESTFSPQFVAALKRPLGLPALCARLVLMSPIWLLALLSDVLKWAGDLGAALADLCQDWTNEVQVLTRPVVFSELKSLRERAEAAERDASAMRWVCNAHKADIERAQVIVQEDGRAKDPNWEGFPVIEWSGSVPNTGGVSS